MVAPTPATHTTAQQKINIPHPDRPTTLTRIAHPRRPNTNPHPIAHHARAEHPQHQTCSTTHPTHLASPTCMVLP